MKRIVIAPDSFKGSLSAEQVATAIANGLHRVWPEANCVLVPMADGGEGTLDACLHAGGERLRAEVTGAGGSPVTAEFGIVTRDGKRVAIIEVAQVVGITESSGMSIPVERRTSHGVGELIRRALDLDVREFLIGLGGSSTNDGGAGVLTGLGAEVFGDNGQPVHSAPAELSQVREIELRGIDPRLKECRITIMSDVNNPLAGPRGATAIFGPQKGVTPDLHERVDPAIAHFAGLAETP